MSDEQDRRLVVLDADGTLTPALRASLGPGSAFLRIVSSLDESLPEVTTAGMAICHCTSRTQPEALRTIHQWLAINPDLPVLVLSGGLGVEEAAGLMRAGATDLLSWPLREARLLPMAVAQGLRWREERRERRRQLDDSVALLAEQQERLRALREDEEAGRRVQQKILPLTPREIAGCHIEHRVVPSLYLSGDFIDYFGIGESCLAFYLADVSGHGASSAFVTLLLKTLGNRVRRDLERDGIGQGPWRPSLLLDRINRELLALGLGKHVAMLAGVVDLRTRELHYASAGQYPQLIVCDGKCAQYVGDTGMPVGLFDTALYEDRIHALPTGFTLVLFSDGVFELMDAPSLAEKEARLLELVNGGETGVEALSHALALDGKPELPDDVAMLVIRETAAGRGA